MPSLKNPAALAAFPVKSLKLPVRSRAGIAGTGLLERRLLPSLAASSNSLRILSDRRLNKVLPILFALVIANYCSIKYWEHVTELVREKIQ